MTWLHIGFKLFALILFNLFITSNIDYKIWHSQFNFKRCANVFGVMIVIVYFVNTAFAEAYIIFVLLALDYAKILLQYV